MEICKLFHYKKHIHTIFRPLIDLQIKKLNYGLNTDTPNNLIISLTTYGNRLKEIKYTLFSLFSQSLKPDKIVLWLDDSFNNDKTHKLLKNFIQNGLEVRFTKDIGPYTKLIPALLNFPDSIIVTADDDIFYPQDWLKLLYQSYLDDKTAIHCHRAHKIVIKNNNILPYEQWVKQIKSPGKSGYNYFLTGVGGVLYPQKALDNEVFNEKAFLTLAPNADDIWYWAMAVLNGTKIKIVKNNISTLISTNILRQLNFYKEKTLYYFNRSGGNDEQFNKIIEYYPDIKHTLIKETPIQLIYNITSLHSFYKKNGHRAGIFNAAFNIMQELINDAHFDIAFYSDYKYFYFIKEVLKQILPESTLIDTRRWYEKLFGKLLFASDKISPKLMYIILYTLRWAEHYFPFNNNLETALNNYDAYFTPFEGVEKEFIRSKIKNYQFIHDVIPLLDGKQLPDYHWAKAVFANISENIFYFTNSEYTKQDFLKVFSKIPPNNVKTAHLGVTTQSVNEVDIYTKYNIPKNKKYFLSLCSLGKRKNLEFAVKNFITFVEQYHIDDLVFVLAGGIWNNYKQTLDKLIKNSSEKIIITGYIEDTDLPALYSNALAFIYPSLYEGFGLPILEAMGYNCPVIASNRTSLPEICADAALLINPENDVELQDAYKTLYYNTGVRNIMIEKGYRRFKEFSWEKCANIIKEIILANKV